MEIFDVGMSFFGGFCAGCLFTLWYLNRFVKNLLFGIAKLIGPKFKNTDISFKDLLSGINTVIEKSLKEVERAEEEKVEKDFKSKQKRLN